MAVRVLFTLGTTPFVSLEKAAFEVAKRDQNYEVTLQTQNMNLEFNTNILTNFNVINYYENFSWVIENFDIVVSHGGAGTIFKSLEAGIKLVVVPNLERADRHQTEICNFIERASLAYVQRDISKINHALEAVFSMEVKRYKRSKEFDWVSLRNWING